MPATQSQHPDMRVFCSLKLRFPSNVGPESEARVFSVDVYGRLRKLSPAAPEHRSGIVGELLQSLCKVAPKPPEKDYGPVGNRLKYCFMLSIKLLCKFFVSVDKTRRLLTNTQ